ncbi:tRNA (guanosine(37)-N1)-methyltransferase TrmD [Paroceanicella profunda]|uniref:tRNA (guanine-N(1)-)-methyltransferase n=1 Tax=Paroceanicella profunda TaxID=2579971 RepID=A0A5B8FGK4_9RHOB|nr:tRNA (guanosine(37)-N1)-methyltransferase TrmD [Paroceanicella profunda]QDL90978.1 tRNA (guanosine(37)-N1)-methyltransferase TrmD [Paroceanicella profunda]
MTDTPGSDDDTGAPETPGRSHGRLAIRPSAAPRELMGPTPEVKGVWRAKVLTLYPGMFPGILGQSLTGRALDHGLWALEPIDIRMFARDRHRTVDDTPAGGGPGMVMRPDVVSRAIDFAQPAVDRARWPLIYLSPRGKPFDQAMARRLSRAEGVTLLCGRFEGVDERLLEARQVEEVSLGDFVLTGGELAAQVLIDATVRLIPRVLGNAESVVEESFSSGLLEHPHYTRPQDWEGRAIPEVLLSGHHAKIAEWRKAQSERLTQERRPDLWRAHLAQSSSGSPAGEAELSDAATNSAAHSGHQKG